MNNPNFFIEVIKKNLIKLISLIFISFVIVSIIYNFLNDKKYNYEVDGYLSVNKESFSQNDLLESFYIELFKGSKDISVVVSKYEQSFKNLLCRKSTSLLLTYEEKAFEELDCYFNNQQTPKSEESYVDSELELRIKNVFKLLSFDDLYLSTFFNFSSSRDLTISESVNLEKINFNIGDVQGGNKIFVKYNLILNSEKKLSKKDINSNMDKLIIMINDNYNESINIGFSEIETDLEIIIPTLHNNLGILLRNLENIYNIYYASLIEDLTLLKSDYYKERNKEDIIKAIVIEKNNFSKNLIVQNISSHQKDLDDFKMLSKIKNIKQKVLETNYINSLNYKFRSFETRAIKLSLLLSIAFFVIIFFYTYLVIIASSKK